MSVIGQILNVPGLSKMTPTFLYRLWDMARRNDWDVNGIAATISSESDFNAGIKNPDPRSTASGLIQIVEKTARGLGTTAAAIRSLSAEGQLPYIEAFFKQGMRRIPGNPADYKLVVFGRGDLVGASDDAVLWSASDPKTKESYDSNPGYDLEGKRYVTVGDVRRRMAHFTTPSWGYIDVKTLAAAGGVVELMLVLGGLGWAAMRRKKAATKGKA